MMEPEDLYDGARKIWQTGPKSLTMEVRNWTTEPGIWHNGTKTLYDGSKDLDDGAAETWL